jgi:hypothetical protein
MANEDPPVTFRELTPEMRAQLADVNATAVEAGRLAVQMVTQAVVGWLATLPLEVQVETYRQLAGKFFDLGDDVADALLGMKAGPDPDEPPDPPDVVDLGQDEPADWPDEAVYQGDWSDGR